VNKSNFFEKTTKNFHKILKFLAFLPKVMLRQKKSNLAGRALPARRVALQNEMSMKGGVSS